MDGQASADGSGSGASDGAQPHAGSGVERDACAQDTSAQSASTASGAASPDTNPAAVDADAAAGNETSPGSGVAGVSTSGGATMTDVAATAGTPDGAAEVPVAVDGVAAQLPRVPPSPAAGTAAGSVAVEVELAHVLASVAFGSDGSGGDQHNDAGSQAGSIVRPLLSAKSGLSGGPSARSESGAGSQPSPAVDNGMDVGVLPRMGALDAPKIIRGPPPKYRLFVLVFVAVYTLIVVASYTSTPALASALDSTNKPGFTAVVVLITVLAVVSLVVFLMVPLLRMLPGVNAWFTSPYRASWGDGPVARFGYWLLVG